MENILLTQTEVIDLCGGPEKFKKYDSLQVKELVSGRMSGLKKDEISHYADPSISAYSMNRIKNDLLEDINLSTELKQLRNYLLLVDYYYRCLLSGQYKIDELSFIMNAELVKLKENQKNHIFKFKHNNPKNSEEGLNILYALSYAAYLYDKQTAMEIPKVKKYITKMR